MFSPVKRPPPHHRTLYRYGSIDGGHFGYMALAEDGRVLAYSHPNESRYKLENGYLIFANERDEVTNRLRHGEESNVFLSDGAPFLYLLPLLSLPPTSGNHSLPPIFVNSIPKSGTYFLEAALSKLGAVPLRLHLASSFCHDYRGISEDEMHRHPDHHILPVPAGAIAHLMRSGDLAVGHVDNPVQLNEMSQAGVRVMHAIRDLRDVLVSLYRFKRSKVAPTSPADSHWRSLDPQCGFIAFLNRFETLDIALIFRSANTIIERSEPILRYENIIHGELPAGLDNFPGLDEALREARGQPTSTLSDQDDHASPWSDAAEGFFQASGFAVLNERLGYGSLRKLERPSC